jgi:hypothetical protein
MRPLFSAPRQPYRVYSEEEFLAAEDWCEPLETEPAIPASGDCAPRPWGRAVVCAALSAVVVAMTGVVVMNEARSKAGSGPRFASRRVLPRLPFESSSTNWLPTDRAASSGDVHRRLSAGRASAMARPVAGHGEHVSPPLAVHTHTSIQTHTSIRSQPSPVARAVVPMPAATREEGTASTGITVPATVAAETGTAGTVPAATTTPVAASVTTATHATAPAPTATTAMAASDTTPARGASSEFGFER